MNDTNRYTVKPGYIVIDVSSATGGVTHDRRRGAETPYGRAGVEYKINTTKTIDHKAIIKISDSLVQAARYALRCHAANTTLGWYCDKGSLPVLADAFDKLSEQADLLNAKAIRVGSARRVRIGMVPIKLDVANEAAAAEIARTVHGVCADLHTVLRAGEVDGLAPVFLRAKNLEKLAVGMQRDSVVFAIENAKVARTTLREAKRDGKNMAQTGAGLDLEAIEACMGMFADVQSLYDSGTDAELAS